jgi:glycosyltransferase involved in cell wall biosynthesis
MNGSTMTPNRSLRVCHLAYTFYEVDNRVMRYVQTLSARGDEVDVIALRGSASRWRESAGSVRLYRIQRRSRNEKRATNYLLKLAWFLLKSTVLLTGLQLRRRYDVVHVHNIPDFLVFAAWLPKLMGARIILDIHDIVPELYAGKFEAGTGSAMFRSLAAVEQGCCRFADHVIVANHIWHDRLLHRSVAAVKCTTFLNYPDLAVFKPVPRDGRSNAGKFQILYPGSLNHHQGVDLAIKAVSLVKDQMPDAELHIYGRGPALEDLIRLARDCGVEEVVKFKESVDLTRIATVMASASVGIVPKRADGFGNEAFSTKTFEFMACGVPLIVSRTRIDDYYFNERQVNFFEPGNAVDLAKVLLKTYQNPADQLERVREALGLANHYSWQVRNSDYRLLIDSLATVRVNGLSRSRSELSGPAESMAPAEASAGEKLAGSRDSVLAARVDQRLGE